MIYRIYSKTIQITYNYSISKVIIDLVIKGIYIVYVVVKSYEEAILIFNSHNFGDIIWDTIHFCGYIYYVFYLMRNKIDN